MFPTPELNGKTVHYLGPKNSYSHEGALELQRENPTIVLEAATHVSKLFAKKEDHKTKDGVWEKMLSTEDACLIPGKNAGSGMVTDHWKLIMSEQAKIVAEVNVAVNASIGGNEGTTLQNAVRLYSHKQGIEQTSKFRSGKKWEVVHAESTAAAAEMAAKDSQHSLAIASPDALKDNGLAILAEDMGNLPSDRNFTQMFVMVRNGVEHALDPEKEFHALMLRLPERVGTLVRLLNAIRVTDTNITTLHSFPDPKNPNVVDFFFELENYNKNGFSILAKQLEPRYGITNKMHVLGSWNERYFTGKGVPERRVLEKSITGNLDAHVPFHQMIIRLGERRGVLSDLLTILANADINLTDIASHIEGHNEYSFQISMDASNSSPEKIRLVHEQLSLANFVQQMEWRSGKEPLAA